MVGTGIFDDDAATAGIRCSSSSPTAPSRRPTTAPSRRCGPASCSEKSPTASGPNGPRISTPTSDPSSKPRAAAPPGLDSSQFQRQIGCEMANLKAPAVAHQFPWWQRRISCLRRPPTMRKRTGAGTANSVTRGMPNRSPQYMHQTYVELRQNSWDHCCINKPFPARLDVPCWPPVFRSSSLR